MRRAAAKEVGVRIADWIWWAAYGLVGVDLARRIRRGLRGGVGLQASRLPGLDRRGLDPALLCFFAVMLYSAMGLIFYLVLVG